MLLTKILNSSYKKIIMSDSVKNIGDIFENYIKELKSEILKISGERHRSIIEQAKDYIDGSLALDINLNIAAEKFYLSPCYFSYLFKKEMGINFNEFLIKKRIERSKYLLKNVKKNVSDVALEVGYKDSSYFSVVFKKRVGMSPRDYRNLNISGEDAI